MKNPVKYLGNEEKYLKAVLNSENWTSTSGSWTSSLEKEFAKKFQAKYAIAFNSGTSTMHSALLAAGIKPGDEVIVPDSTWIASAAPISYLGATPIFADINPKTWCISYNTVKPLVNKKTKAIIAVNLYGNMPEYDDLKKILDSGELMKMLDKQNEN